MPNIVKKVCMCGDPNVGKTSLVKRFVHGKYDDKYISTLGTVVSKKSVQIKKDENMTMMIWDISGQPEFKRIQSSAFKNAKGGIAVCDVTRPETVENLTTWISALRKSAGPDVPVMVMANKTDLATEDDSLNAAMETLGELNCNCIMTSAKTGDNVNDAFKVLAQTMTMNIVNNYIEENNEYENEESYLDVFSPSEFLDYVAINFCNVLGDEEFGMHMVRKQVNDAGIDFNNISKNEVKILMGRLIDIIQENKGQEISRKFKQNLFKNFANCSR